MNHPLSSSSGRPLLAALLLVAAVAAVFGQVYRHEFVVWDDTSHITDNPHLNPVTCRGVRQFWQRPYWGLYIPLSYTFFAAEASIARQPLPDGGWGPNPIVFHLGNLALHMACVLAVFAILRRLFRHDGAACDGAACAGALLFALHPLQVESVAWVSETRGVLCGLFSLLAIWQYLCHADTAASKKSAVVRYVLATACFVLALLCKPAAVAVPLIVGALDIGLLSRPLSVKAVRRILYSVGPWLLVAMAWIVVTKLQQPDHQLPLVPPIWARPLLAGDALAFYLVKLLLPYPLGPDYGRSPQWVMQHGSLYVAWLLPVGVLTLLALLKDRRVWLTAAAVSIVWLLPVLGFVPFVFQRLSTVADRYMYLALLGPALALSWFLAQRWNRRTLAATSIVLCLLAGVSFIQTGRWRNSDALLTHALQVNPRSGMMKLLRGVVLAEEEQHRQAIEIYQSALKEHPDMIELYLTLAKSLSAEGRLDEGVEVLRKAVKRFPREPLAHCDLGIFLAGKDGGDEAIQRLSEALRLDPSLDEAHAAWGNLLLDRGQLREAIEHFRGALAINPAHVPALVNLAVTLQTLHRLDEARDHYLQAIEIRPNWPKAHYNLANLLRLQGKGDEAVKHYRLALHHSEDKHAGAHINLGITLIDQGEETEAIMHFRTALKLIPPDSAQAKQIREFLADAEDSGPVQAPLRN